MANFSDVEFEERYKQFLQTQREWLELVAGLMFYSDKNANGEDCRPIAFTNKEKVFQRAHELVQDWQRFADLADEKRKNSDIAITTVAYTPVPTILVEPLHVTVNRYKATSTTMYTRENLINRYDKQIAKLRKVPFAEGAIQSLEAEKKAFVEAPEASRYRARTSGYHDTVVEVVKPGQEKVEILRPGVHGMLIYGPKLNRKKNILVSVDDKADYSSLYDLISPIACAILPNAKLYSLENIENAKLISQQRLVVERTINARRFHFDRRVQSKLARKAESADAEKVAADIEARRQAMEELNKRDWEIFDLKVASGDSEVMTMAEMREKYGDETESRRGKPLKTIVDKLKN